MKKVVINGICYELDNSSNSAFVCSLDGVKYAGDIILPFVVYYEDKKYLLVKINDRAFKECDALTSITIPYMLDIGIQAFADCKSLLSVNILSCDYESHSIFEDLTRYSRIEEEAFRSCQSLTSLHIGNYIGYIGDYAFYGCSSITSVVLPNNLMSIGDRAFCHCSKLTNINFPESLWTIGEGAFYSCCSLASISITGKLSTVNEKAFAQCKSLTSIVFPEGLVNIHKWAFAECDALNYVSVPSSLSWLGYGVFEGAFSIKSIDYGGTIEQWYRIYNIDNVDWRGLHSKIKLIKCVDGMLMLH